MTQQPGTGGSFSDELQIRLVEARASLAAAEALDDALSAQIAAADLADLRALAARNDLAEADALEAEPDAAPGAGD
jgi:hypothetical protein